MIWFGDQIQRGAEAKIGQEGQEYISKRGKINTEERAVSGRGETVTVENHAEPTQCLLESVRRKIEAGVLSQKGQDLALDQPDQLQEGVTQSL